MLSSAFGAPSAQKEETSMSEDSSVGVYRVGPDENVTEEQWRNMDPRERVVKLAAAFLNAVNDVPDYAGDGGFLAVAEVNGVRWRIEAAHEGADGIGKALNDAQLENTALRQSAMKIAEAAESLNTLVGHLGAGLYSLATVALDPEATPEALRTAAEHARSVSQDLLMDRIRRAEAPAAEGAAEVADGDEVLS